jgi:phospholipid transport system substrate-binding protein
MMRCASVVLLLATTGLSWGAEAAAVAAVEDLHATLISVMKDAASLGYSGRYARIQPAVERDFDLDFMARFVLGPGWKDLSPADQQRWRTAFEEMTVATYAGRFTGYGGEQFRTLGEEAGAEDSVFVRTVFDRPDADDVQLTYRLRRADGRWQIVDVYQKGTVSELALRRSEYATVLKREGFAKLLESVNQKAAAYAANQ